MATSPEILEDIAAKFPLRNRAGYVCGYFVYGGYLYSEQLAGPFPSVADAEADEYAGPLLKARHAKIICGHVTSPDGNPIRETRD